MMTIGREDTNQVLEGEYKDKMSQTAQDIDID